MMPAVSNQRNASSDTLLRMEYRGYHAYMPATTKTAGRWALFILLAVIASRIALGGSYSPEQIYMLGAALVWMTTYTLSALRAFALPENPFREWWLTLPLPRKTLVRAHMLGALPFSGCLAAAVWLIATAHNALEAAAAESALYADADRLIGAAFAFAILYAALAMLFTFAGMLITVAMQGWRQLCILAFLLLWGIPTSAIGLLTEIGPENPWLSPLHAAIYAAAALALAAAVYRLCLYVIPRYGFQWIAVRRTGRSGHSARAFLGTAAQSKAERTDARGFRSLYQLERSAFRSVSGRPLVRLVYAVIAAGMAAGGYFSLPNDQWVEMVRALLVIPGIFIVTIVSLRFNFDTAKRRLEWVLVFPYSRVALMLSRMLGAWVTASIWLGGLALATGLGALVRFLVDRPANIGSSNALGGAAFMLAVLLAYVIVGSLLSVFQYGYGNMEWLGILSVPIMIIIFMGPMLVNQFFLPEDLVQSGITERQWLLLAASAIVSLPLAWQAFVFGSRRIGATMYLIHEKQRKRGGEG